MKNKDKISTRQKELYDQYKSDYLPFIFCHKLVQLNTGLNHLKTLKYIIYVYNKIKK